MDMGLEPFNVASALNLVLAQRLVRRICSNCKVQYVPDKIELEKALQRWTEVSWFLDETVVAGEGGTATNSSLPRSWRLGSKPATFWS